MNQEMIHRNLEPVWNNENKKEQRPKWKREGKRGVGGERDREKLKKKISTANEMLPGDCIHNNVCSTYNKHNSVCVNILICSVGIACSQLEASCKFSI